MSDAPDLRLVEFGTRDAWLNMALDRHLLDMCESDNGHGYLRLYRWSRPTLSLGFFEDVGVIDCSRARRDGIDIVRRPTGGRVVLHGDDLTYCVVVPRRQSSSVTALYRLVSECLVKGISRLGLRLDLDRGTTGKTNLRCKPCFVSASRHEVTCGGRKVVGSAQKAGLQAVLQHGSIPLGSGYLRVVDYMSCSEADRQRLLGDMKAATCNLYELLRKKPPAEAVASALVEGFTDKFRLSRSAIRLDDLAGGLGAAPKGLRNEELRPADHQTKPLDTSSQPFI